MGAGPLRPLQNALGIFSAGNLEDEGTVETALCQLFQELGPRYLTVTGWQMVIELLPVVTGVHHPKVSRKLMGDRMEIPRQEGVAGVEAYSDVGCIESSQQPHQITHRAGEEMGQHVLQHQVEVELSAMFCHAVEDAGGVLHAIESLGAGDSALLRTWVDHVVAHPEDGGGIGGP